jgi:hypothetical protein
MGARTGGLGIVAAGRRRRRRRRRRARGMEEMMV